LFLQLVEECGGMLKVCSPKGESEIIGAEIKDDPEANKLRVLQTNRNNLYNKNRFNKKKLFQALMVLILNLLSFVSVLSNS